MMIKDDGEASILRDTLLSSCLRIYQMRPPLQRHMSFASTTSLMDDALRKLIQYVLDVDHRRAGDLLNTIPSSYRVEVLRRSNDNGHTTLHLAALTGDFRLVKMLLESIERQEAMDVLYVRDRNNSTPLQWAVYNGYTDVVSTMLDHLDDAERFLILRNRDNYGSSAVLLAAYHCNNSMLSALTHGLSPLRRHQILSQQNEYGRTSLHYALMYGNLDMAEVVIQSSTCDSLYDVINSQDRYGWTAIHYALLNNHVPLVSTILKKLSPEQRQLVLQANDHHLLTAKKSRELELEGIGGAEKVVTQEPELSKSRLYERIGTFVVAMNHNGRCVYHQPSLLEEDETDLCHSVSNRMEKFLKQMAKKRNRKNRRKKKDRRHLKKDEKKSVPIKSAHQIPTRETFMVDDHGNPVSHHHHKSLSPSVNGPSATQTTVGRGQPSSCGSFSGHTLKQLFRAYLAERNSPDHNPIKIYSAVKPVKSTRHQQPPSRRRKLRLLMRLTKSSDVLTRALAEAAKLNCLRNQNQISSNGDSGCGHTSFHTGITKDLNTSDSSVKDHLNDKQHNYPIQYKERIVQPIIICCPTEDYEDFTSAECQTNHPADDFIAVKIQDFSTYHPESSVQIQNDRHSTGPCDLVQLKSHEHLDAVTPLHLLCENVYGISQSHHQPVSAKKLLDPQDPDYDDDEYLQLVRGITSIPHDFAPERVVVPVYTVPRYPDNHNPLLPLSLQKKLDEMSPREFLTYVLNELTLEERESLMVDERQRRKSFLVNWPYDNQLSGVKLAQAGFYSVDDYDRVQCVFCRGSLHRWEQDDVPMLEHARSFAFCRFVKGLNCGNREYISHKLTRDDMKNINLYKQPEMRTSRDGSVETDGSALGISTNRAAMIEYAPDASRLKTYNRWPAASPVFAKDLCEAGFYYTGFDDQVRCFYCAGGIREWATTDIAWEEHARWFPECEYVLQKKGEEYVTEVHSRTPANKKTTRTTKAQKREAEAKEEKQSMVESMYEECLKFGHEEAVVIRAMKSRGPKLDSIKDLIEVIYKIEESGPLELEEDQTVDYSAESRIPEEDLRSIANIGMDSIQQPGVMHDKRNDFNAAPEGSCKYCFIKTRMIREANYIGLPCGHMIYCEKCNNDENIKLRNDSSYKPRCPFNNCGAPLTGTFKTYRI